MIIAECYLTSEYSEDIPSEEVSRIMDKTLLDEYKEFVDEYKETIKGKSVKLDYEIETIEAPMVISKRLSVKINIA
jgi:hypothetical protein